MTFKRLTLASAMSLGLASPAFAQAEGGGMSVVLMQMAPLLGLFVLMYFLLIRPQQQRQKKHQQMIMAVKRGDTVVLSSGVKGKVVRVEETEVGVEIATGITVKVVKSMIADVQVKGSPAPASDGKA